MNLLRNLMLLLVVLIAAPCTNAQAQRSREQADASVNIFWQKFKGAVISGNKAAVASMSRFPVEMSYGIAPIRNRAQMLRRYREVFSQQANAAQCFSKKQPEIDAQDTRRFVVACPDSAGNEVVIYQFQRTRAGWKFVGLDNINE